jgi:hypothetical protein
MQRLGVLKTAARTLTTNIVRGGTYAVVVLPVAFIAIQREFRNRAIAVGQSVTLQAGVWDANERPLAGRTIQWTSSNPGRASVDAAGRVTGLTPGDVRMVATGDGVSDSDRDHRSETGGRLVGRGRMDNERRQSRSQRIRARDRRSGSHPSLWSVETGQLRQVSHAGSRLARDWRGATSTPTTWY